MGLAMSQARDLPSAVGGVGSTVPTAVAMAVTALAASAAFVTGRRWVARHSPTEAHFQGAVT